MKTPGSRLSFSLCFGASKAARARVTLLGFVLRRAKIYLYATLLRLLMETTGWRARSCVYE